MLEKRPGWQLMTDLLTEINVATPIDEEEDRIKAEQLDDRLDNLVAHCMVRKDEIFPEDANIQDIITGIMTAVTANCVEWPDEVVDFILSHNHGADSAIQAFIADRPGWKAVWCQDPRCGRLHVQNPKQVAENARQRCPFDGDGVKLIIIGDAAPIPPWSSRSNN